MRAAQNAAVHSLSILSPANVGARVKWSLRCRSDERQRTEAKVCSGGARRSTPNRLSCVILSVWGGSPFCHLSIASRLPLPCWLLLLPPLCGSELMQRSQRHSHLACRSAGFWVASLSATAPRRQQQQQQTSDMVSKEQRGRDRVMHEWMIDCSQQNQERCSDRADRPRAALLAGFSPRIRVPLRRRPSKSSKQSLVRGERTMHASGRGCDRGAWPAIDTLSCRVWPVVCRSSHPPACSILLGSVVLRSPARKSQRRCSLPTDTTSREPLMVTTKQT